MPTPSCHAQNLVSGMLASASDRIAFVAAGVVGSAPLWYDWAKNVSDFGAIVGPGLAAAFVGSKIVLTWVQIWKTAAGERRRE
jgi:hypothetical protein